jgi:hypothetical protein
MKKKQREKKIQRSKIETMKKWVVEIRDPYIEARVWLGTPMFLKLAFTSSFGFHSNPDLIAIYEPINPNLMFFCKTYFSRI